jgi:cell wall-associated NlpC family hydrolase
VASIADERDRLVAELAELQGVSVALAGRRQSALERLESERAGEEAAEEAAGEPAEAPADEPQTPQTPQSDPAQPEEPEQEPEPPAVPEPPAPAGGADAAVAFARAQLGEPYVWGAAGPSAWDCSGLTMQAWAAGGVSLPHYSAAQYDVSTPISASELRPGDLVFWGSSGPSSIHHVALYLGDGLIIHAPRTGRPVSIDSMYYWVPPDFYGRV